ncbi:MAG: DUF6465 family protein [Eubacterium sp.]|nr:DUF6465 family protein [Eubacterium sp.]
MDNKTTATKAPVAKAAETAKTATTTTTTAAAKPATTTTTTAAAKPAAKKPAAKKPAAKKPAAKKPAAKKAAPAKKPVAKKAPAKKTTTKRGRKPGSKNKVVESVQETIIQFQGADVVVAENLVDRVKEAYKNSGHRVGNIKSLRIYVNVEEKKAYYVINDKQDDSNVIDL